MESILRYYEFSDFIKDESGTFSEKNICFCALNSEHFLIFANIKETYNLYISKYSSEKEIGKKSPQIVELIIKDYDKSIPEHRIAIRRYLF